MKEALDPKDPSVEDVHLHLLLAFEVGVGCDDAGGVDGAPSDGFAWRATVQVLAAFRDGKEDRRERRKEALA